MSRLEKEWPYVAEKVITMGRIIESLAFAMILTACAAVCTEKFYESNHYTCQGLEFGSQLPEEAVGIEIVNSNIRTLPTGVFLSHGDYLEELNITNCGVEIIERDAFQNLNKLRILGLAGNKIDALDASWLKDLPALEVLIVWNNNIVHVNTQIYNSLSNLQIWDIAYNDLVCLQPESLKKLTKLKEIYLSGNRWSYRCRVAMMRSLESNHVHSIYNWDNDLLIEDCLAHAPNASVDDDILKRCVENRYNFLPNRARYY